MTGGLAEGGKHAPGGPRYDTGYAWLTVLASFVSQVLASGIVFNIGIFYLLFSEHLLQNDSCKQQQLAVVTALVTALHYFTGPVAGVLTARFGCRPVAVVGGLLTAGGLALSAFVTDVSYLLITFGIIPGVGIGLAFFPSVSIIGQYFRRRLGLAMGLSSCGSAVGALIFPLVIDALNTEYGWRGAMLLLGGIMLNMVVCGALYRPQDLLLTSPEVPKNEKGGGDGCSDNPAKNEFIEKCLPVNNRYRKMLSHQCSYIKYRYLLRLDILTQLPFFLYCLNQLLHNFSQSIVYVHLAAYVWKIGYTESTSYNLFVYVGVGSLIGRFTIGLISQWSRGTMPIIIFGQAISAIMTLALPSMTGYGMLVTFAVVYGLTAPSLGALLGTVPMEILDADALPCALGYIGISSAVGFLTGGPVAAVLYGYTETYTSSFYLAGAVFAVAAVCLLQPALQYGRNRRHPPGQTREHSPHNQLATGTVDSTL